MASGFNVVYMFWSSRHWRPLVNGYSGYAPPDFQETVKCMDKFPDAASIARLRGLNVGHVLLHGYYYSERERTAVVLAAARSPDLIPVGRYRDWIGITDVFALAPATQHREARLLDQHTGCGD